MTIHEAGAPADARVDVAGGGAGADNRTAAAGAPKIVRHFREILQSEEGISSNVLADRLATLVESGIVTRADDPSHSQKAGDSQ